MKFFFSFLCMVIALGYFLLSEDKFSEEYVTASEDTSSLQLLEAKSHKRREKINYDRQIASIKEVIALDEKSRPEITDYKSLKDLTKKEVPKADFTEQKKEKERIEAILDIDFDPTYLKEIKLSPKKKANIPHCPEDHFSNNQL